MNKVLVSLVLVATCLGTAVAATIHVPADQPTIQAGVSAAVQGDTILLAAGIYSWSQGESMPVLINKPIILMGDGTPDEVILDGESLYSVLMVSAGPPGASIRAITVRNAKPLPTNGGGLIITTNAVLDVSNCHIENCQPDYGAGVYADAGSTIVILDSRFSRNRHCDKGGGVFLKSVLTATIARCQFQFDTANWGGGIYIEGGMDSIIVEDCFFDRCRGPHGGGVCVVSDAPAVIRSCTFLQCEARFSDRYGGGAIDCEFASPTIEGNLVYQCAGVEAGGIRLVYSSSAVVANTIVGSIGPAIGYQGDTSPLLFNNILAYTEGWGVLNLTSANNIHFSNSCLWQNSLGHVMGNVTADSGIILSDPRFCDSASGDFSLRIGSACLGGGAGGANVGAFGLGCVVPSVDSVVVDTLGDNLHVVDHTPIITFHYLDTVSNPIDSIQVEVGSDNDWSVAELWSSGYLEGPDTVLEYSGSPLSDGESYWLQIRVSTASGWSNWFETTFRMNSLPGVPVQLVPEAAGYVSSNPVSLSV